MQEVYSSKVENHVATTANGIPLLGDKEPRNICHINHMCVDVYLFWQIQALGVYVQIVPGLYHLDMLVSFL